MATEVSFKDGFQDHSEGLLYNTVTNRGNSQGSMLGSSVRFGLLYVYPPDRTWFKDSGLEVCKEFPLVFPKVLLPSSHINAIASRRFLSSVLPDMVVGSLEPISIVEQVVECTEFMFGLYLRSETKFPLHFADIHRSILPCLHSASPLWKHLQAMGLPHADGFPALRVLRPI